MKINENDDKETGDQGTGEGGQGGKSGEIAFRYTDVLSVEPRDDVLPPIEIRRILAIHKDIHKERVDKQKLTRKERQALKEGRIIYNAAANYRTGIGSPGGGTRSQYKTHPIAAKFSGMDPKVNAFPSENISETNLDKKNELENRLENKLRLQNAPRFNPKPRPY